ncbi:glutamic acid-rich protein [Eurytemora carolleeae]|uniref:glutamic acid-rich protein n=1 Tax=Eurytemora carolleeae TaxID=1294199 RepID=UPI000C7910AD|nr:glutamic acid-rich protein [Eurytemora carolleeae]|eukprot:XP_023349017.1 glutamic acid-rich protein-like [Eurytemora affinis]
MPYQTIMPKRGVKEKGGMDPKTTALTQLGISIGSKNMRSIQRSDIDTAFVTSMHESVMQQACDLKKHEKKTRRQDQQTLHEAYQLLIKHSENFAGESIEEEKRKDRRKEEEEEEVKGKIEEKDYENFDEKDEDWAN